MVLGDRKDSEMWTQRVRKGDIDATFFANICICHVTSWKTFGRNSPLSLFCRIKFWQTNFGRWI
jgi:hypothetical protein